MKYIFLFSILIIELFASVVQAPIISVDKDEASIKIDKIDVGMSGFIVHELGENHKSILKNAVVTSFDKASGTAVLKMSDFDALKNNSLPKGNWHVEVGDSAILAFGYSRGFLIAPSEEIYHRITKSTQTLQWIHPDIFATLLSLNGHPTPVKEDFDNLRNSLSVGLVFIYLNQKLFMLDVKSLKILNISEAPLKQVQENVVLPFYTRVEEIDAAWWGEGSDRLQEYEPHYYRLLLKYNEDNKELKEILKGVSLEEKKTPLSEVKQTEE
ncbi:plasminogen-binding N-terminal domain-containing protein [bacterium]|nr:plasminogen-binding N-terminal domain-containing protein [bacterium]